MSKTKKLTFITSRIIGSGVALVAALVIYSPVQALAVEAGDGKGMTAPTGMENCQMMMQQHAKMMEDMKAQDVALTAQVATMNKAPADKKTVLLADIVTQLVAQRTAMDERMDQMHMAMGKHMMGHLQMGKESMAQCPMMNGKMDMGGK